MIAWKFFAPFRGVRWPLPDGTEPGAWIEAGLEPGQGVRACALPDLPYWLGDELWEVELAAPVARVRHQLIAPRGRLIARVNAWASEQAGFTRACIDRTRLRVIDALRAAGHCAEGDCLAAQQDLQGMREVANAVSAAGFPAAGYVSEATSGRRHPGFCAYVAANAAAAIGGERGHDAERASQAQWLKDRLALRSGN